MSDPSSDHIERYSSAVACVAAGISTDKLKSWSNGPSAALLIPEDDMDRRGRGIPLLLSFRRVVHIALTAQLVRHGLRPVDAAAAAAKFTDFGDPFHDAGNGVFIGKRLPGQLYQEGRTLLVVMPSHSATDSKVRLRNIKASDGATRLLALLSPSATIVDVSSVVAHVRTVLDGGTATA
ncbi:hypothetical protein [Roseomonas sp. KE0001]|uniref:hypothetical protein n=1 Tax=Roseomonas sp. KE0001 TaxID=2479201 RepID=UPI0018E03A2E|nr:hypothetical protein [Roseomonas sp. KE0001]MBI0432981.1 hypothetical protein [Roseomonas sp. KE0001]